MKLKKLMKKKRGRAIVSLALLMLVLLAALGVVAAIYLRSTAIRNEPEEASPSPAPAAAAAPVSRDAAPQPSPAPYTPVTLKLDVMTTVETLDIAVCDENGSAVPGYAFPLEITRTDGGTHSVATDVNGHYFAEYVVGGEYTVTIRPPEGFVAPTSVRFKVPERLDYRPIENLEELVEVSEVSELPTEELQSAPVSEPPLEVEQISTEQEESAALTEVGEKRYLYHYSVGENGCLLLSDGSESDVMPVEQGGTLAFGMRKVTRYFDNDGKQLALSDIPEDAVLWTDYYAEEQSEKVTLIVAPGQPDPAYAITVEEGAPLPVSDRRVGWVEEDGRTYYYSASGRPVTGLKNIDGRLYYFDESGAKAKALGIDVSYFNSSIDWNAVKAAGMDFAIVRVAGRTWGKGILFEDEDSYRQGKDGGFYLQGAKAAGLKVGAYVYSNAINTNEAVEEASLAIEVLRKSGVTLDMPIYLDLEHSGEYPSGRADRLSFAQRAEIVKAFCTTVENSGYRAGVYASEYFFSRSLHLADVADYDLWYAVYTWDFLPPAFRDFDIWQFTETVRINGMPDFTDMNVIF